LERPAAGRKEDFESFNHFHGLAKDILLGSAVRNAYDLEREDPKIREMYLTQGVEPAPTEDPKVFLTREREAYGRAVRDIGIKMD
jgi:hypothetical protein